MAYIPYPAFGLGVIGVWTRTDISTLGAADVELNNIFAGSAAVTIANPMPIAGRLRALSVKTSGDVGAAGNDLVVTVYKNGVATALTATITGGAGTENEVTTTVTPISYAAGDDITVYAKETGAAAAVQAVAVVWGLGTGGGAGGGGGSSTEQDTYANLVASVPTEGTTGWPSDSFYLLRSDGTNYDPWGPIFPMTQPVDGDFAWVNQGGATVSATKGGIFLLAPTSGTDNLRVRIQSAPATPYTVTAAILPLFPFQDFYAAGLVFRESGTGELANFAIASNSSVSTTSMSLFVGKYNSPTSFSATYTNVDWKNYGVLWLRIADDGANRICSVSNDGQNFLQIHTVGRTDFLTADQIGFYMQVVNTTYTGGVLLLSWLEA